MCPLTWAVVAMQRTHTHCHTPLHEWKWNGRMKIIVFLCCFQFFLIRHFDFSFVLFPACRWKRDKKNEITYQIAWNEMNGSSAKPTNTATNNRFVDDVDAVIMNRIRINQNVISEFTLRKRYFPLFSFIIIIISLFFYRFIPATICFCGDRATIHSAACKCEMQTRWRRRQLKWNQWRPRRRRRLYRHLRSRYPRWYDLRGRKAIFFFFFSFVSFILCSVSLSRVLALEYCVRTARTLIWIWEQIKMKIKRETSLYDMYIAMGHMCRVNRQQTASLAAMHIAHTAAQSVGWSLVLLVVTHFNVVRFWILQFIQCYDKRMCMN